MKNVFAKNLTILYFIAILFFIRTGNLNFIGNSYKQCFDRNNISVTNIVSVDKNHTFLTVSMITGETIAGFTLAEVLLTLLIIGVVGSLVIPGLIQDTQDAELKTSWKKAYSELNQATKRLSIENGGSLKGVFTDYHTEMMNKYLPYLSYVKACTYSHSAGNCWHKYKEYYGLNNTPLEWEDTEGIVLNNGVLLRFDGRNPDSSSCSINSGSLNNICGWINVDVNGFKGPNKLGKDIFDIWIFENKVLPFGVFGDNQSCSGFGRGCSAQFLYQ